MGQSPLQVNNSTRQEIFNVLLNPNVYYCAHKIDLGVEPVESNSDALVSF
jgi:hypothetical protein